MKTLIAAASFTLAAFLVTGCAGISTQNYGPHLRGHQITEGATRADVLANMGGPTSIFRGEDTEVFVYKGLTGRNYFGLYNSINRIDRVVVMNPQGVVLTSVDVEGGRGRTFVGPLNIFDSTYPVSTDHLTSGPENYSYDWSFEK